MSFHLKKLKSFIFVLLLFYSFYIYFNREEFPKEIKMETKTISTPEESVTDLREKLEKESKVLQVIVLAVNPRSGSTYLAEILASTPLTSLWQEPLRFLYEKPPVIWYVAKKNSQCILKLLNYSIPSTHCSKSWFFFCPKIQLRFPEKIVDLFGLFSCWQHWFHEKNCQKKLGEKLVKMLVFCQNWIFGQKFDF